MNAAAGSWWRRPRAVHGRALGALALGALALTACSRTATDRDRRPGPEPAPGAIVAVDAASSLDAPPTCVAECVRSRQMHATGVDVIERDCARLCAMPQPPALP